MAALAVALSGCSGEEDTGRARPAAGRTPIVVENATPIGLGRLDPAAAAATAAVQAAQSGGAVPASTPVPASAKPDANGPTPTRVSGAPARSGTQIGIVRPSWESLRLREQELNAQVRQVTGASGDEYVRAIDQLIRGGANVIITVGADMTQATQDAAERNPNIRFVGVDQYQEQILSNVVGFAFDDDQAGFLAGALAGMMTKSNFVGAVMGPGWLSPMVGFGEGFVLGAEYVNPNVIAFVEYHPGELPEGYADQKWGRDTANQMVADGADVIFAAGGATGQAAIDAARTKNVFSIGAEIDQYDALPNARSVLLTSIIKVISTQSIQALVRGISDGSVKGGNVLGDLAIAAYREAEPKVPKQVRDRLQTIERGLKQGSVKTGFQLH